MALTKATTPRKLPDCPSIMDYNADSQNDDTTRITRAIADGCTSLFIPDKQKAGVFTIGDCTISETLKLFGHHDAGYREEGAAIRVPDDASFGLFFKGTGNGTTSGKRVIGGGLSHVSVRGKTNNCQADLIKVQHCSSMLFDSVSLFGTKGNGFNMRDFMESRIRGFYINSVGGEDKHPFYIGDIIDASPWNVNNLHIEEGTMGACGGNWLHMSDSSNADGIWFEGNKLEWDADSLVPNSVRKAVIYVGGVERFFCNDNIFTYFFSNHNMYDTILEMSTFARYGSMFTGNLAWGCDTAALWDVKGGQLLTDNNQTNSSMVYKVSSVHNQGAMKLPEIRTPTGNRPTSYTAKSQDVEFISAHVLTGANASNTFEADADSVKFTSLRTVVSSEVRRAFIPKDMVAASRVIEVSVRVKNDKDVDATLQLVCNGTAVNYQRASSEASTTTPTLPASSGWTTLTWYIPPSAIGSGSLILRNNGGAAFLFDGMSIKYATQMTIDIPWSAGTITTGSTVNTTVTLSRLGSKVSGVSQPVANGSMAGAVSSSYFNSNTNQLVLQASRIPTGDAVVAATSYKVVVFF